MFGDYHFNIPSGQYSVTCSAEGFDEQIIDELELSAEQVIRLNFSLTPSSDSADPEIYDQQNEFYFYPNPFTDELYIDLPDYSGISVAVLTDIKGAVISKFIITENRKNLSDIAVDLDRGIYLLKLIGDSYLKVFKLVKK